MFCRETKEIEKAKALSLSESTCTVNSSSSKEKKGGSHTGQKSPLHMSTNSSNGSIATSNPGPNSCTTTTMNIVPPVDHSIELSHKEKRSSVQVHHKEELPHEEKRSVQVKPPPGLGNVVTLELLQQEAWPSLDAVPAKKGLCAGPPPGFQDIVPRPSHHSMAYPVHSPWPTFSQALTTPPGLVVGGDFATLPNSANVGIGDGTKFSTSPFMSNNDVVKVAEGILSNNPDKVSRFRSFSGKYQSGAVSVDEYHSECELLFGSTWKEIGPRLATTIPDKRKQDRLLKKFGLPWFHGGSHNHLSTLSEEEYPSLGSKVGIPTHAATPSWSCKVSVK